MPVRPGTDILISGLVANGAVAPAVPGEPNQAEQAGHEHSGPETEAPGRHLRLVPRRRRRASRRWAVCLGVAGVLAIAFGLVGLHVVIAEAQFRLDHLQQEASTAQAKYERLRLLVSESAAPARIVSVAEAHGMEQPATETYLPAPRGPSTGHHSSKQAAAPGEASAAQAPDVVQAPAGDADWPAVKPYLSGSP